MPVRKLTRGGMSGEQCGDGDAVSGGQPNPLGAGEEQDRQKADDTVEVMVVDARKIGTGVVAAAAKPQSPAPAQEKSGGEQQPVAAPQGRKTAPRVSVATRPSGGFSASRLEKAAADVISELHGAKQELAKELEANLKQLKSVLQETQRIAKDMEAVLQEAQAKPKQEDLETKAKSAGNKKQQSDEPWDPPTLKKQADSDDKGGQEQQKAPPAWEPPEDALQPQQQH